MQRWCLLPRQARSCYGPTPRCEGNGDRQKRSCRQGSVESRIREEGVMGGTPFGILGRSAPESVANNSAPKSSGSIYKPTAPFSRSLYSRSLVPKNRKRLFAIFAECVHYCSDQGRWIRDDLITIDSRSILPQQSSQGSRLNWWLYRESQPALSFPNQARLNDAPPPSKPKSAARKRLVKA